MFHCCGIERHNLCSVSPVVVISDLRLLNFLFMDWENAVTVFKGIALFEFKEMKMGLLTRTSFSVCFHIRRVLKKRRQKKKRQLGALICVNPRTLRGRSCRMWNIKQGCRGWQGICRKVFIPWDAFCSVCGWKDWGRCFAEGELPFGVSFPVLVSCSASRVSVPEQFTEPAIPTPCAGLLVTSLPWELELPSLSWGRFVREYLEIASSFQVWLHGLCCALRTWTVGVLSWFGPLSWKLHTLKCKISLTVVKYHHKSLIWSLEVIKPRGCLLLKTLGQENKQLGAHLEHGCFWNRHGKYWNSS